MAENENRKSFVMYNQYRVQINKMSDEEAGVLLKAIMQYQAGEKLPEMDSVTDIVFSMKQERLDSDSKKYTETCKKKREAGKKGGRPKKKAEESNKNREKAFGFSEKQKPYDTDTVTDTDTDTVTVTDTDNKNNFPLKSPEGKKGDKNDEGFLAFWQAYPRKCGKADAEKAYLKLNPSKELQKTILEAVERNKASPGWNRDNGKYIPYPSTWLNGRRWEDEQIRDSSGFDKIFSIV